MFGKLFGKKEKEEEKNIMTSDITSNTDNADVIIASKKEEQKQSAPLTYKEMKSLQKSRYEDIAKNPKFKKTYLLRNNKTGQMAEIRASSSFHACNIIGWKANKVTVIKETEIKEYTIETSNANQTKKVDASETTTI